MVVLLLAARWIWVAGLGDYGWTWEAAARLLRGQVYYRDFPSLYGPLSHYTLAGLMALAGSHLFVFHLHLWLWYALALGAGLAVMSRLGVRSSSQTAGLALAAVISCPAFFWGHAFNYQATFLAGAATWCALRATAEGPRGWAAWAGLLAGLTIFARQNVGLTLAALIPLLLPAGRRMAFGAGLLGAGGSLFAAFAWRAGASEVFHQLLLDAAAAKGGLLMVIARATPRIILAPGAMGRRWWELAITLVCWAALGWLALRLARRRTMPRPADPAGGWQLAAGAAAAAAASLFPIGYGAGFLWPWLWQLTYIFLFLLVAAHLGVGLPGNWAPACILILATVVVQEGSNPNFPYSAPLAIPLLFGLLDRSGVRLPAAAGGALLGAVWLLGAARVGAAPAYALPSNSPFAGLRAPQRYAAKATEMWDHLRPQIQDRTTLWLTEGGPFLAYGGLPAPSAPVYMTDSFPARLDARLLQTWQRNPPEFVVLHDRFWVTPLLAAPALRSSLLGPYRKVWQSRLEPQVSLWKR